MKNFQGHPDSWGIGSIEVDESEWKSEIPTLQRLAVFDLQDISGNFSILPAWSDFHDGSQVVFTSMLKKSKDGSLNFVTGNGLVTIPDQERQKFSGLVKKLS